MRPDRANRRLGAERGCPCGVGLAAPHLVRRASGEDPARLLVPSALAGALMLVLADLAAKQRGEASDRAARRRKVVAQAELTFMVGAAQ